jgi:hypothetical protein
LQILDEKRIKKFPKVGVTFSQWKMRHKEMQKGLTPLPGTIFSRIFLEILRHVSRSGGASPWRALLLYNPPQPPIEGKHQTPKMEPKAHVFAPELGVKT